MHLAVKAGIFVIPNFFSGDECARYIAEAEATGFEAATIQTRKGAVLDAGIRNNERLILDDKDLAHALWLRLREHIPLFMDGRQAIGLNERFRFYRYEPGQYFAPHTDGSFRRQNWEESRLTLLIYLNDDFQGGETAFADDVTAPARGMALVFRHELMHEGRVVISSAKYVLRSDVMFNPVGRISG
jgi:predicted 2-oxoglutarate/Fe(II)-dependent dioxygenase YbiX